ncbi:MAG: Gfo/Idh/MocA family oxidoreductase [Chloroflexi bacterium]|nr:Gfo/Idh/MocA family oxidoreductase [Chloroflexota bacterium]
MRKIRVGVIGVGQIGKRHVSEYQEIEGAEVVAIADINQAELDRVSEQYNIPNKHTDFLELVQRDDIEAVDVCLHNNLHVPATVAAFEAGKHVCCEKPMAGSYRDAQIMYDAAQELNCKLSIPLRAIYQKGAKVAKALVDRGLLGKLYHARSTGFRRRGRPYVDGYGTAQFVQREHASGGALYDMGVYHISLMLHLLGNPQPLRISGKIYQETDMDPERQELSGYDVEELGMGFVRLEDGISLDIIEAWAIHLDGFSPPYIVGSKGGIRLTPFGSGDGKGFGFYHSVGDLDVNSTVNLDAFDYRVHSLRENADAYDSHFCHWIAALQGRVELLPTAELALNTMLISEGIYLSDELGREVTAEEVKASSKSVAIEL